MKLNYRPEIDGLRAISVLAVIFYHSELFISEKNLFQGGFLGVDFFFCNFRLSNNIIDFKRIVSNWKFFIKKFL